MKLEDLKVGMVVETHMSEGESQWGPATIVAIGKYACLVGYNIRNKFERGTHYYEDSCIPDFITKILMEEN